MANGHDQMGENASTAEVPPIVNSGQDAFLQLLLTQVVQVVQDTIAQELERREDLGNNLLKIHKMNPPEFEDSAEPGDILDWMTDMEKLFSVFKPPEEQKVAIATYYLKKSAYEWWEASKPTNHDPTWDEFKAKMESRYYPSVLRNEELSEIFNPRPERETVDEAAKIFYRVFRINQSSPVPSMLVGDEKHKIRMFEKRMSGEIRKHLAGHNCKTLEEYVTMALTVEAGCGGRRIKRRKRDYARQ